MRHTRMTRRQVLIRIGRHWALLVLVLMLLTFSFTSKNFLGLRNCTNIVLASVTALFLAAGETLVIVSGGIDLSIGFVMGLVCVTSAIVMRDLNAAGLAPALSIPAGVGAGLLISLIPGWVNGQLIARFRVPPFIATLGMWGIANGLAWKLSEGLPIASLPLAVRKIGMTHIAYYSPRSGFSFFVKPELTERADILALMKIIPLPVLVVAVVLLILGFILAKTRFGQHTYAIGGKADSAIRAGINVKRHLTKIYMLSSFCAGCAGVMLVFLLNNGVHTQYTSSYELFAVAAVVIGGASLMGGRGSIWGTVIGVLLISTLNNGLMMMGLPIFYRYIAVGVILIGAVLIDRFFPELVYES
jgi:ribose/xylose/arabinose/galactoside ABC-type transport system permease subunit